MRFFTVLPKHEVKVYPEPPLYRKIAGLEWRGRSVLLPKMPGSVFVEDIEVPEELGEGIALCFEYYYVNNPSLYRNCHLGALAMTQRRIFTKAQGFRHANFVAMKRKPATLPLSPGAWAVKAIPFDGGIPLHSIVGVNENTIVQIDDTCDPISLAGYVPPSTPDYPYYVP